MRIFFYTQGCKVNQVETENLKLEAEHKKFKIVKKIEEANMIVVNSCAVTENATKKLKSFLKTSKNKFPDTKLVVSGCGADMLKEKLSPFADLIITNAGKNDIFQFIEKNSNYFEDIENIEHFQEYDEALVKDKTRGFLKIQDGCDETCAYCIIPKLRGKPRSRNINSVMEKFTDFVKNGYKEIVLVGIHIGKYGVDINSSLKELLKCLSKVEGDFRIRLSSLEVNEIEDEVIDIVLNTDKFCPHFHIPLQSGSDKILNLMNRKYLKDEFIKTVKKIKDINPYATVGCDVIVGFPGETEKEFEETVNTIIEAGINYLHVFPYSKREGTPAFSYKTHVDEITKNQRAKYLREISNNLRFSYAKKFFGKDVDVLIESENKGLTANYLEALVLDKSYKNELTKGKVVSVTFDGNLVVKRN